MQNPASEQNAKANRCVSVRAPWERERQVRAPRACAAPFPSGCASRPFAPRNHGNRPGFELPRSPIDSRSNKQHQSGRSKQAPIRRCKLNSPLRQNDHSCATAVRASLKTTRTFLKTKRFLAQKKNGTVFILKQTDPFRARRTLSCSSIFSGSGSGSGVGERLFSGVGVRRFSGVGERRFSGVGERLLAGDGALRSGLGVGDRRFGLGLRCNVDTGTLVQFGRVRFRTRVPEYTRSTPFPSAQRCILSASVHVTLVSSQSKTKIAHPHPTCTLPYEEPETFSTTFVVGVFKVETIKNPTDWAEKQRSNTGPRPLRDLGVW